MRHTWIKKNNWKHWMIPVSQPSSDIFPFSYHGKHAVAPGKGSIFYKAPCHAAPLNHPGWLFNKSILEKERFHFCSSITKDKADTFLEPALTTPRRSAQPSSHGVVIWRFSLLLRFDYHAGWLATPVTASPAQPVRTNKQPAHPVSIKTSSITDVNWWRQSGFYWSGQ